MSTLYVQKEGQQAAERITDRNPFPVELRANYDRAVTGLTALRSVVPILSVAGAYASGDFVGQTGQAFRFVDAVRTPERTAIVQSAVLADKAAQSANLELWLFAAQVVAPTDNAAWTITDEELGLCQGVIALNTHYASGANSVTVATNCGLVVRPTSADLYGVLVARATPTYAAGDLRLTLALLQD